eukprot:127706-Prymnesium_polylepis.1
MRDEGQGSGSGSVEAALVEAGARQHLGIDVLARMAITWQPHGNHMATIWQSHGNRVATTWQSHGNRMAIA